MEINYSFINYKGGVLCVFLAIGTVCESWTIAFLHNMLKYQMCILFLGIGIIIGLGIGLLIGEHYILSPSKNGSLSTDEIEFPTWSKLPTSKLGIYAKAAVSTDTNLCGKVGKYV